MSMALRVEDYVHRLRDGKVERELAAELRARPEAERLHFIQELTEMPRCFGVAMWLAKTCLKERSSLETVLAQGLDRGDASTVKYWLEAVIHGLGFRRVVQLISGRVATDPGSAIKAEYWLRNWLTDENRKDRDAFAVLHEVVEKIKRDDPTIEAKVKPFRASSSNPGSPPTSPSA
jgi:hypothetical protein